MNVIEEANRIKDRLRACTSKDQIETVADEERETVLAMKDVTGDGAAMSHQIRNLKGYMLRQVDLP